MMDKEIDAPGLSGDFFVGQRDTTINQLVYADTSSDVGNRSSALLAELEVLRQSTHRDIEDVYGFFTNVINELSFTGRRYPASDSIADGFNTAFATINGCRSVVEKLDLLIAACVSEENSLEDRLRGALSDEAHRARYSQWAYMDLLVKRTFPDTGRGVDVSGKPWSGWDGKIPSLNRWRRAGGGEEIYREKITAAGCQAADKINRAREGMCSDSTVEYPGDIDRTIDTLAMLYRQVSQAVAYARGEKNRLGYEGHGAYDRFLQYLESPNQELASTLRRVDDAFPGYSNNVVEKYLQRLIAEHGPNVQQQVQAAVASIAEHIVVEELEALADVLSRPLTVDSQGLSVSGLSGEVARARHEKSVPSTTPPSAVESAPKNDNKSKLEMMFLAVPSVIAGWIRDEDRHAGEVLQVVKGNNGVVLVVDLQNQAMRDIADRSAVGDDYIGKKLNYMATMIATSKDGRLSGVKSVYGAQKEQYGFPVLYQKVVSPNAPRVYVCEILIEEFERVSSEVFERLKSQGVYKILALIGTCDKSNQESALKELTGQSRSDIRARGGGSI